jgi:hypothetical protein
MVLNYTIASAGGPAVVYKGVDCFEDNGSCWTALGWEMLNTYLENWSRGILTSGMRNDLRVRRADFRKRLAMCESGQYCASRQPQTTSWSR